eukprot:3937876-Rhodomonas_salina.3
MQHRRRSNGEPSRGSSFPPQISAGALFSRHQGPPRDDRSLTGMLPWVELLDPGFASCHCRSPHNSFARANPVPSEVPYPCTENGRILDVTVTAMLPALSTFHLPGKVKGASSGAAACAPPWAGDVRNQSQETAFPVQIDAKIGFLYFDFAIFPEIPWCRG